MLAQTWINICNKIFAWYFQRTLHIWQSIRLNIKLDIQRLKKSKSVRIFLNSNISDKTANNNFTWWKLTITWSISHARVCFLYDARCTSYIHRFLIGRNPGQHKLCGQTNTRYQYIIRNLFDCLLLLRFPVSMFMCNWLQPERLRSWSHVLFLLSCLLWSRVQF